MAKSIKTGEVIVPIKLTGDAKQAISEINELQNKLKAIQTSGSPLGGKASGLDSQVEKLKKVIDLSKDATGNINNYLLEKNSKKFGVNIDSINRGFKEMGLTGVKEIQKTTSALSDIPKVTKKSETAIDKLGKTLINSLRYNVVNIFIDSITRGLSNIGQYYAEIDKDLNNIRIVTGKSQEAMDGFFKTAEAGAKSLSISVNAYAEAAQTFYQQGLATEEVIKRTNATIMAANISQQSVSTTAEQVTAVLNGFDISANNIIETLDKLAAVGAGTATDFEEIATASQKVASAANTAGFSLDDTLGILSTISSVTREAPESIGTSLNAIIGRLNDLTLGDEVTSGIQKAYNEAGAGLSILNEETGQLKSGMQIFEELAGKWDNLNKNQKAAITTAMAGTRQANRLLALFNNWDMFESYREMSENADGALEEQNRIYQESLEAYKQRAETASQTIWSNLLDIDSLKEFYSIIENISEVLAGIVENFGGLKGMIGPILTMIQPALNKIMAPAFANAITGITTSFKNFSSGNAKREFEDKQKKGEALEAAGLGSYRGKINFFSQREFDNLNLSPEQKEEYRNAQIGVNKYAEVVAREKNITSLFGDQSSEEIINITNSALEKFEQASQKEIELANKKERAVKLLTTKQEKNEKDSILLADLEKQKNDLLLQQQQKYKKLGFNNEQEAKDFQNKSEKEKEDHYVKLEANRNSEVRNITKLIAKDELTLKALEAARTRKNGENSEITDEEKKLQNKIALNKEKINVLLPKIKEQYEKEYKDLLEFNSENDLATLDAQISELTKTIKQREEDINKLTKIANNTTTDFENLKGQELSTAINQRSNNILGEINNSKYLTKYFENSSVLTESLEGDSKGRTLNDFLIKSPEGKYTLDQSELDKLDDGLKKSLFNLVQKVATDVAREVETDQEVLAKTIQEKNKMANQANQDADTMARITQQARLQKAFEFTTRGAFALGGAYNSLKQAMDETATEQQKLTSYVSAAGSLLSIIPGWGYAASMAIQTLGPIFIEVFGLGISQLEKFSKEVEKTIKKVNEFTQSTVQQKSALSSVDGLYRKLAKSYQAQAFAYENLTEEERAQYDQVAEYVSQYAPELVKYYDVEGKAVIDLTKDVNYLTEALNKTQQRQQKTIFSSVNENYGDLIKERAEAEKLLQKSLEERAEIQKKIEEEGYTQGLADKLSKAEENISKYQTTLSNFSVNFNKLISEPLVLTAEEFGNLSQTIQNSLKSIVSYDKILENNIVDFNEYQKSISNLSEAIAGLTEEEKKNLEVMSEPVRGTLLETLVSQNLLISEYAAQLKGFDQQSIISGDYFDSRLTEEKRQKISDTIQTLQTIDTTSQNSILDYEFEGISAGDELAKAQQIGNALSSNYSIYSDTYKDEIEALNKQLSNDLDVEKLQDYADMLMELTLTNEGYNEVVQATIANQEKLKELQESDGSLEEINDLTAKIGRQVAALNADNEVYYARLRDLNKEEFARIYEEYGINLFEYETFREAQDAIDEYYSKKRLIRERYINGDLEKLNEELLKGEVADFALSLDKEYAGLQEYLLFTEDAYKQDAVKQAILNIQKGISADQLAISEAEAAQRALDEKSATYQQDYANYQKTIDDKKKAIADFKATELGVLGQSLGINLSQVSGNYAAIMDAVTSGTKDIMANIDFGSSGNPLWDYDKAIKDTASEIGNLSDTLKELDLDPLKEYIDDLEELNHQLSLLDKHKEMSYGKNKLQLLEEEIKLNKQLLETETAKQAKIAEVTEEKKAKLLAMNSEVVLGEFGQIENYNDLLLAMGPGETTDALKEAMDEYEEWALDKTREVEESILDLESSINDLFQEQIELSVELILEGKDRDLGILETISKIQQATSKEKFDLTLDIDTSLKSLDRTYGAADELLGELDSNDIFQDILNGNSELDQQTQMDILTGQLENLQTMASDLTSLLEEMDEAYEKGLSDALSLLDDMISKYDNVINQYEYIISLSEQLGNQNYDYTLDSYNKMADIYRNNLSAYQDTAQMIKESRDVFEEGTDEWLTANDKYLEAQAKVIEEEKNLAEVLGRRYDVTVTSGRQNLENILFGGLTAEEAKEALEDINKQREKYLDTEEKIYRLSKLSRTMQEDSDSYEGNPQVQAKIKKFMQEELGYLNDKKKLTETDLELSEKQYAVLKARIELEEAYANKQYTQILQRNQDGTFGYMYVLQQNEDLDKAKQTYEDSINDLYQFAETENKELQQEAIDIRNEFLEEYDTITTSLKNGTLTQEEAVKKLQAAYNTMYQDIEANQMAQNEMQDQMVSAKLMQILGVSEDVLDGIDNFNDKIITTFDILEANRELGNMQSLFEQFGIDFGAVAGSSAGEQMSYLYNALGGAGSNAASQIQSAMIGMGNATSATLMGLLDETGDFGELSSEIFDASILGSGEKLDEFLSAYTNGTITSTEMFKELFANGFDETELNWETLQGTLITDIDSFKTQFTDTVENVVSQVTAAYEDYHEVLEMAMTNAIERTEELDEITGILNEELEETLDLLEDEINELTKLIRTYQDLKDVVIQTLEDIEKMINAITDAIKKLADALKELSFAGVGGGEETEEEEEPVGPVAPENTPYTADNAREDHYSSVKDYDKNTGTPGSYNDAYVGGGPTADIVTAETPTKNLNKPYTEPTYEEHKKTAGGRVIIQKFHSGGLVGRDPSGLFAIVKKNEKVLTEEQARITDRIYDNLKAIPKTIQPTLIREDSKTDNIINNYHIDEVTFPNAKSAQEIEDALRNLDQTAVQYTGRANRYLGRNR